MEVCEGEYKRRQIQRENQRIVHAGASVRVEPSHDSAPAWLMNGSTVSRDLIADATAAMDDSAKQIPERTPGSGHPQDRDIHATKLRSFRRKSECLFQPPLEMTLIPSGLAYVEKPLPELSCVETTKSPALCMEHLGAAINQGERVGYRLIDRQRTKQIEVRADAKVTDVREVRRWMKSKMRTTRDSLLKSEGVPRKAVWPSMILDQFKIDPKVLHHSAIVGGQAVAQCIQHGSQRIRHSGSS